MSEQYAKAGVNIETGDAFVEAIKESARRTQGPQVLGGLGGFAAYFLPDLSEYKEPVLVSSTDGVGTKLRLAIDARRFDTIGIDLVAMCANDLACSGAKPLFFLDYLATGKLKVKRHSKVVNGIASACEKIGCALIGGETAEMPGMYKSNDFDLAGFIVGIADRSKIINGHSVKPGQTLLGVASSGFHSNGYSLVRKIINEAGLGLNDIFPGTNQNVADALLAPTLLYNPLISAWQKSSLNIHGIAHITGGGLTGNVPRMLNEKCTAQINWGSWKLLEVFNFMQKSANMSDEELLKVFNCGVGLVAALNNEDLQLAQNTAEKAGFTTFKIGQIVARKDKEIEYV